METWLAAVCQTLSPGASSALAIACAVLALLVLALIVLGFTQRMPALRQWLGVSQSRSGAATRSLLGADELLGAWRLYRELGRVEPRDGHFFADGVPGPVVPKQIVEPR